MFKIAHLADVHIRNIERHDEYQKVFQKIYDELKQIKPDRIVIVGDLFESFIEISNEAKIIAGEFLNNLSKIAKVIITRGNHDIRKKNTNRIDSIETIIKLINNPNINYYNQTDFYKDDNITWVVYDHVDKTTDPWLNQTKDKNQIYIGLFHDPIQDCSTDLGRVFNDPKLKDINYFKKNDFLFLGDIHKRQFFRKNNTAAYCGSTIQQNFGEKIENHGFLVWNIDENEHMNFNVELHNIDNDHTFVNLYIDELTDYDNLNLSAPKSEDMDIKVHWKDYSANINTANERKIRDYIKNKFDTTKIKFEKTYIYNDVVSSKMLSESLDLTDIQVQTSIFKEYLEEQKYKKEDIDEILKIDELVNNRLHLSNTKTNISWSIDKFWFSNFKSYGDDNEINWKDTDGIIQVHGLNQEGKTSILDAITYILYGKTTTTLSPEKYGDNRYINNKRNKDYCLGGAIIDVDGEKFVIQRETERVWNKNKTSLTGCPTTLDYYKSEVISEKNKLTGEEKKKTQAKLDLILGDLKDFIRLSFTNADNLNDALSETRSVFMDNIIRDAGYDIFETKLEEFKEFKKELNEEKLIVDIQESETQVLDLGIEINTLNQDIAMNKGLIENFEKELKEHNKNRDELNKKLNKIDQSMISFDENLNLESIKNYNTKISESNIQLTIMGREIDSLPSEFDSKRLNDLKIKLKETNDKISERKDEISKIRNLITESDNKKDKVLAKIKELKDSEIRKLMLKISDNDLKIEIIKNQKENVVNEEIRNLTSELQKIELEKSDLNNKMKLLQKDGVNLKNANDEIDKDVEELKNSTSCPTCGRDYEEGSDHLVHLQEKIDELLSKKEDNDIKIQKLLNEYKRIKNLLPELEQKESNIHIEKGNLKEGIFPDEIKEKFRSIGSAKVIKQENDEIKIKIEEIKNNNFTNAPTLNENISKGNQILKNIEKSKNDNLQVIKNLESELRAFNIEDIESDISTEEKQRDNFELRKQKLSQKDNLLLTIENFNLRIKELQVELDKYKEYKSKIEENKTTQFFIDRIDEMILIVKDNMKEKTDENIEIEKDILIKEKEIETIQNKITKYLKQKKKEELLKEYQKCISRDGIPTFLLKKSIHLINKELSELLTNVDFTLFFDENLILRMSADDRLDVSQNAIESSGMERTFCSLALKIALRQINVKSKPTFIFLDEIMGKLLESSVQQFIDFLDDLKTKVKKIVIIEHIHPINFDGFIDVKKDPKTLISKLEIKF
jgi:DNA repair exonuclease SbcCD ATPase subunit/DNA repair exonuclease SbcCD nuclease subunit